MNFNQRSYTKELLDRDDIPFEDILQNMRELNTINHLLGGHAITRQGLRKFVHRYGGKRASSIHIVEIGSGGGDNLRILKTYCDKNSIPAHFTGIDINPHCVKAASDHAFGTMIEYIESDYLQVNFHTKPDIIFSSLFCHHFSESALVTMFHWMYANSNLGFFVNDLQRHPLAYYSISTLTSLFSNSYLVKNDAPLSVRRGFHKKELELLLQQAGISVFTVEWKWAFRYLVVASHPNQDD